MASPFDDLTALLSALPEPDAQSRAAAAEAFEGLGRLGEALQTLAAWQGRDEPQSRRPIVALYAAAHAGTDEPAGAARARLEALAGGTGPLNQAARELGAGVEAFDLALDRPAPDAAMRAAMSERECAATIAFGMEAVAKGPDLLILGEITAGAERAAGGLAHALFGGAAEDWSGEPDWVGRAAERARTEGALTPLDLLRQLGGRETAALVGAILAGRVQKVPVLLDGYAAAAAAAVLETFAPGATDHCLAAGVSPAPGHRRLLQRIGKAPLLDLGLSGPGLCGLAALGLLRVAATMGQNGETPQDRRP